MRHIIAISTVLICSTALAAPTPVADAQNAAAAREAGVATLQRLVANLGQAAADGKLGTVTGRGGELRVLLQAPAASVPGGGLSMTYVAGNGVGGTARTATMQSAAQSAAAASKLPALAGVEGAYTLGETLGLTAGELGNYVFVVHMPFNIALTDAYKDPVPAENPGGKPIVRPVPAPSSTLLGLLGVGLACYVAQRHRRPAAPAPAPTRR